MEQQIAILEGYDPDKLGTPRVTKALGLDGDGDRRRAQWDACRVGRKTVVTRVGVSPCSNPIPVEATSKRLAHMKAVIAFREQRQAKRQARSVAVLAGMTAAQRSAQSKFKSAAAQCKGKGKKFRACMRDKLKK